MTLTVRRRGRRRTRRKGVGHLISEGKDSTSEVRDREVEGNRTGGGVQVVGTILFIRGLKIEGFSERRDRIRT